MIETCMRCGAQTARLANCKYCKKAICYSCVKSQKRISPVKVFICKSCWSNMASRKNFKSSA